MPRSSQTTSSYNAVPEIHYHVAGTLSKQETIVVQCISFFMSLEYFLLVKINGFSYII